MIFVKEKIFDKFVYIVVFFMLDYSNYIREHFSDGLYPNKDHDTAEDKRFIQGTDLTVDMVINDVYDFINGFIDDGDIDNTDISVIHKIWCHGSRLRGNARPDSDLDVVVFYSGRIKEDSLFNILNEDNNRLTCDGFTVDINPIQVNSNPEARIKSYIEKSREYDKEVLGR